MTRAEIVTEVQGRTKRTDRDSTIISGLDWANLKLAASEPRVLRNLDEQSLVSDQVNYDLPSDFLMLRRQPYIKINEQTFLQLEPLDERRIEVEVVQSIPSHYALVGFNSDTSRRRIMVGYPTVTSSNYTLFVPYTASPGSFSTDDSESILSLSYGAIADEAYIAAGEYFLWRALGDPEKKEGQAWRNWLRQSAEVLYIDNSEPMKTTAPDSFFKYNNSYSSQRSRRT